jgi:cystathionine beta-lyase
VPFARLPDKDVVNNSVTFNAVSKTFNLAGMKNAYFHSSNPVLLERLKLNFRADLNTLGVVANEAAYRQGGEWIDQLLPYLDDNHTFVENHIAENIPLIRYKKAQGTYLTWFDTTRVLDAIGAHEIASAKDMTPEYYLQEWLVENSGVYLNPGSNYGTGGAGHMRMNLGSSRIVIKEALDAMAAALRKV